MDSVSNRVLVLEGGIVHWASWRLPDLEELFFTWLFLLNNFSPHSLLSKWYQMWCTPGWLNILYCFFLCATYLVACIYSLEILSFAKCLWHSALILLECVQLMWLFLLEDKTLVSRVNCWDDLFIMDGLYVGRSFGRAIEDHGFKLGRWTFVCCYPQLDIYLTAEFGKSWDAIEIAIILLDRKLVCQFE